MTNRILKIDCNEVNKESMKRGERQMCLKYYTISSSCRILVIFIFEFNRRLGTIGKNQRGS